MPIKHILIVDDSKTEQLFLLEILERHGFQCRTAADAAAAALEISKIVPDLILLDVVMPGMNGFQYLRELTKDPITANIPVLMCSSKNQPTDRMWGLRQGAKDYLFKPVNEAELMSKISQLQS